MSSKARYAVIFGFVFAVLSSLPVLAQSGAIKGRIKERGGKMLEGVTVRAVHARDEQKKFETKSDAKGEFELKGVSAGDYVLSFERQGFQTFTTRSLSVGEGEILKLSRVIELAPDRPPVAIIRGAVFTGEGLTLPNASVKIERIDEGKRLKRETVSVEAGEFAFRLPAEKATYRITAVARGFQAATKEIGIEGDEVRQIALTLERVK
jgi:carboxypeptidase family protein